MKKRLARGMPELYGAVVVGERGQIVIPADARRDMDIAPGDKLLVMRGPMGNMLVVARADSLLKLVGETMRNMSKLEKTLKEGDEPE